MDIKDSKYNEEKYFFRIQKLGWRFLGFWPASEIISLPQIIFAVFNALEILFNAVFQLNYSYVFRDGGLVPILDGFCPVATQFITALKILVLVAKRKEVKQILDFLHDSFINDSNEKSREINRKKCKSNFYITSALFVSSNLTGWFFMVLPIIVDIVMYSKGLNRLYLFPFKAVYPFDITYTPMYEFIYLISAWSDWITTVGVYGIDGLFIGVCLHLSGQFEIIASRMEDLTADDKDNITQRDNEAMSEKLHDLVKHHKSVNDLTQLASKTLAPIALLHYISSSIVICVCSLMLFLADGPARMPYQNQLVYQIGAVYVYSLGGTLLDVANARLVEAVGNMKWYRCQRKTGINVLFFNANLETFISVIQTAGSYMTLLKTFL